jgi:hypothetical protein
LESISAFSNLIMAAAPFSLSNRLPARSASLHLYITGNGVAGQGGRLRCVGKKESKTKNKEGNGKEGLVLTHSSHLHCNCSMLMSSSSMDTWL